MLLVFHPKTQGLDPASPVHQMPVNRRCRSFTGSTAHSLPSTSTVWISGLLNHLTYLRWKIKRSNSIAVICNELQQTKGVIRCFHSEVQFPSLPWLAIHYVAACKPCQVIVFHSEPIRNNWGLNHLSQTMCGARIKNEVSLLPGSIIPWCFTDISRFGWSAKPALHLYSFQPVT